MKESRTILESTAHQAGGNTEIWESPGGWQDTGPPEAFALNAPLSALLSSAVLNFLSLSFFLRNPAYASRRFSSPFSPIGLLKPTIAVLS